MSDRRCQGCGVELPPKTWKGRDRKWCSESCRKRHCYSGTCVDCGAPTAYSGQARPSERCHPCAIALSSANRKVWTREAIVAALSEWAAEHGGRPPRTFDWNPTEARYHRVEPHPDYVTHPGRWPHFHTVVRAFGSWRTGVVAAGLTPNERGRNTVGLSAACCKTPGNQNAPATAPTAPEHGNQEGPS